MTGRTEIAGTSEDRSFRSESVGWMEFPSCSCTIDVRLEPKVPSAVRHSPERHKPDRLGCRHSLAHQHTLRGSIRTADIPDRSNLMVPSIRKDSLTVVGCESGS